MQKLLMLLKNKKRWVQSHLRLMTMQFFLGKGHGVSFMKLKVRRLQGIIMSSSKKT
jgi:hypothetical protein